MRSHTRSKQSKQKTAKLEKRWYAYALAGAGAVAAAPQAHATIIFGTPTTSPITTSGAPATSTITFPAPIAGKGSFQLTASVSIGGVATLEFLGLGTSPAGLLKHPAGTTDILTNGSPIPSAGPGFSFVATPQNVVNSFTTSVTNVDRFFGLAFTSGSPNPGSGTPNFGWFELLQSFNATTGAYSVTIENAAFESVAGTHVTAGETSDGTPEPATASLVLLALGAAGVQAWRKRKQAQQAA